jgi:hypothetical protein
MNGIINLRLLAQVIPHFDFVFLRQLHLANVLKFKCSILPFTLYNKLDCYRENFRLLDLQKVSIRILCRFGFKLKIINTN